MQGAPPADAGQNGAAGDAPTPTSDPLAPPLGPPRACVIGAGFLGQRIIAELLLLGSEVAVFDTGLSRLPLEEAQKKVNADVCRVLLECAEDGLLQKAGVVPPPDVGLDAWVPYDGEPPRAARMCASIGEAAAEAEIVIEAVPDSLAIKKAVFVEAARMGPRNALLATNTLSVPLARLSAAVAEGGIAAPRVVGLRFLAPVVFIPIVEVTLTQEQMQGPDRVDLLALLQRWRKSAFHCDVQDAAGNGVENPFDERLGAMHRSLQRFRLNTKTASRRQAAEARIRLAHRLGPEAVAELTHGDLFDFAEASCCVCMEAPPTVRSVVCGHTSMCAECAEMAAQRHPRCPICRARFIASAAN